jgi:hypothetical protein
VAAIETMSCFFVVTRRAPVAFEMVVSSGSPRSMPTVPASPRRRPDEGE